MAQGKRRQRRDGGDITAIMSTVLVDNMAVISYLVLCMFAYSSHESEFENMILDAWSITFCSGNELVKGCVFSSWICENCR